MTDLRSLLQMIPQMQGRVAQVRNELAQRTVTGSAGGGMVVVTADGQGLVRSIKIDPSLLGGDVEMLEDLVASAVTEAQKRAADLLQEEWKKLQAGLPFPLPFSL
jgi:hypothetical protein